jgi:RNA polymerase sigma-70 factor (ECF subfamily)
MTESGTSAPVTTRSSTAMPTTGAAASPAPAGPRVDEESRAWLAALGAGGAGRERAVRELHGLLLRAARFEIARRRGALPHLRGDDFDDLAHQSADDALMAILGKLDQYRGESRFTTWAYKFALLEAAVKLRRRAWQGRELPLEPERWTVIAAEETSPSANAEQRELLARIREAIDAELTPHQREVLVAIAINGAPIDVLAERLSTTRGALYKTIHDARKKLRIHLAEAGFDLGGSAEGVGG